MKRQVIRRALVGSVVVLCCAVSDRAAAVTDPAISPGNPVVPGTPMQFSGVGGTNTSTTAGTANAALLAFEAAIGGVKNTAASPQTGGFRAITWDGIRLDGTGFGDSETVIKPGSVVGIPVNALGTILFDEIYAAGSLSSFFANLFPAFSPNNTFAAFNGNRIGLSFLLANFDFFSPQHAATRGFGAIFINVVTPNATSIEYFNGAKSLGKFFVPTGSQSQAEFLGVLFNNPIVTRVQITCGTDVLFTFDGVTFNYSGDDSPPTHNLVVMDDFVYAEPTKELNAQPDISATAGTFFTGPVATFTDLDPNGTAANFTATIDWGDGHFSRARAADFQQGSTGTISANANGGFDVQANNTYRTGGVFPVTVDVSDFLGSTLTIHNTANVSSTINGSVAQALNISTRSFVQTGDDVLIGGFILSGPAPTKVIVRAIGPSLAAAGVSDALQDPILELHDGTGATVATNDNWKDTQQTEIEMTGIPPSDDRESAIVATLVPGNYTAIVRGVNDTTGVALVEVYNLQ
jgi:hypothetical protein